MAKSVHPIRVTGESFAKVKAYAKENGVTAIEAADALITGAAPPPAVDADELGLTPESLATIKKRGSQREHTSVAETLNWLISYADRRLKALEKYETENPYEKKRKGETSEASEGAQ